MKPLCGTNCKNQWEGLVNLPGIVHITSGQCTVAYGQKFIGNSWLLISIKKCSWVAITICKDGVPKLAGIPDSVWSVTSSFLLCFFCLVCIEFPCSCTPETRGDAAGITVKPNEVGFYWTFGRMNLGLCSGLPKACILPSNGKTT